MKVASDNYSPEKLREERPWNWQWNSCFGFFLYFSNWNLTRKIHFLTETSFESSVDCYRLPSLLKCCVMYGQSLNRIPAVSDINFLMMFWNIPTIILSKLNFVFHFSSSRKISIDYFLNYWNCLLDNFCFQM